MRARLPFLPVAWSLIATLPAAASPEHGSHHEMMDDALSFFWGAGAEIDATDLSWVDDGSGTLVSWDAYAWIGDDDLKLRIEAEGEALDGDAESSEVRALLSWNVAEFWDVQAGVRHDFEPEALTWAAFGVQGLAPHFFETDAHAFVSEHGDVAFRLKATYEILLTQRLILEPHVELNAYAQDIPELDVGAGFADVEAGLQLRYEITRKIAPYVDLVYERKLGETSVIAQDAGEDPEALTLRFGLKIRL